MAIDTFECCEYGDNLTETDDGEIIYPSLCSCICHVEFEEYSWS